MAVYRRGDVWWFDFTVNGHRYRASTQQRSKTAAKKVEERERERAKLGEVREALTIHECADRWFAARGATKRSAQTTAQRIVIMLRCVGAGTLVPNIDAPAIEEAIQRRRVEPTRQGKVPTNTTVNRDLIDTTLRPILRYAKQNLGQSVQDIDWKALRLPEPPGRERRFTDAEVAAWRAELPEWHRAVYDFAKRYGVRLREAFFPPDSVDVASGRIFVRKRKNGREHTIRLLPDDRSDIAARVGRARAAGLPTVWFKEGPEGLEPIHWRGFQSASRTALDRAGILDAKPVHDLRHHAGTTLMRKTGNLAAVKRLLGHENIQSTMRYVHADDDDVFDALWHAYGTEEPDDAESLVKSKAVIGT
jgi:hypothetical protein